eukprot:27654_1
MSASDSDHEVNTKPKSISLFIFENFASPMFLHLYKIECKVNDKLKRSHPSIDADQATRTKAMMCIDELTKCHAKDTLHSLSTYLGHNICDVCCLPKDLIQEILEFAYNIDKDLLPFHDMNIKMPLLDKMAFIPPIINTVECVLNILIIGFYLYNYQSCYHIFASIQYILTLCHLLLCHASFFVNASLPFNLLVKWHAYYRMYQGTQSDHKLLRNSNRLLLIPYQQWMNKRSLNIAPCAPNDYIWVFAKCYNYCIYDLIMHHVISLCLTPVSRDTNIVRQWYIFILYILPLLYINLKPIVMYYWSACSWRLFVMIPTFIISTIIKLIYSDDPLPLPMLLMKYVWRQFGSHIYSCMLLNWLVEQWRIYYENVATTSWWTHFNIVLVSLYPLTLFVFLYHLYWELRIGLGVI